MSKPRALSGDKVISIPSATTETAGITLFDKATGEPYCIEVENGETHTVPGVCSEVAAAAATSLALGGGRRPECDRRFSSRFRLHHNDHAIKYKM